MELQKARDLLLARVKELKECLIGELESGYRNWSVQRTVLKEYQEMLKASDTLAGYPVKDEGGDKDE